MQGDGVEVEEGAGAAGVGGAGSGVVEGGFAGLSERQSGCGQEEGEEGEGGVGQTHGVFRGDGVSALP